MMTQQKGYNVVDLPSDVTAAAVDVYRVYKSAAVETVALRGVSLNIHDGEMLALVGPSGSGKSTLLGILGGMLKPTAGAVYWSDSNLEISRLSPNELLEIRRKFVGFVFQTGNLVPHLTSLQNVELCGKVAGLSKAKDRARHLLERVGLGNRLGFIPAKLSSGERQRVAIASALINAPKLVLADEPTGNLDLATGDVILDLFRELNQETGSAIFVVTHSQRVGSRARRVLEIRDGVLVGSHDSNLDIRNLDESRTLTADIFGRISLPAHLLDRLNKPGRFKVRLTRGEIILTPVDGEESEHAVSVTICKNCKAVIDDGKSVCPYCGSAL